MSQPSDSYQEGLRLTAAGRHSEAIGCFENALKASPNDPRVLFALANTAQSLGMMEVSKKFYLKVLSILPDRLEAVVGLANALRRQGDFAGAKKLLTDKLTQTPDAPEILMTLGSVCRETGEEDKAVDLYRAALSRRPGYVPALGNLADILADRGAFAEAQEMYRQLAARTPEDPQIRFNRAFVHLAMGNLEAGWRDYAARLDRADAPIPDHRLPRWQGTFAAERTLLITAEQGIGDQLMFASIFPELTAKAKTAGMRLILECEARLVTLFARSFPDANVRAWQVESRGGKHYAHYDWLKRPGGADDFCEMGTLPAFLRRRIADFPRQCGYLLPDTCERRRWRAALAALPRPRIGLCWRSGKLGGLRNRQYAPLEMWGGFLRETPGSIVCAQYGATPQEIARLENISGRSVFLPPGLDQKDELDRTAAMLAELDALVSAPTAVSWLAAAAGTQVYKILNVPTWTGFGTDNEPFAANIVCATAHRNDDWSAAFASVRNRLSAAG